MSLDYRKTYRRAAIQDVNLGYEYARGPKAAAPRCELVFCQERMLSAVSGADSCRSKTKKRCYLVFVFRVPTDTSISPHMSKSPTIHPLLPSVFDSEIGVRPPLTPNPFSRCRHSQRSQLLPMRGAVGSFPPPRCVPCLSAVSSPPWHHRPPSKLLLWTTTDEIFLFHFSALLRWGCGNTMNRAVLALFFAHPGAIPPMGVISPIMDAILRVIMVLEPVSWPRTKLRRRVGLTFRASLKRKTPKMLTIGSRAHASPAQAGRAASCATRIHATDSL